MTNIFIRTALISLAALAAATSAQAAVPQSVEDRLNEARQRAEERRGAAQERVKEMRQRVCDRLESIRERTGRPVPLPPFCADQGGEDPVPQLIFTATPPSINSGGSSSLAWDSTDADSCTASGGWAGGKSLDGNEIVSPATTTTYALACANDNGTTTKNVTVTVTQGGGGDDDDDDDVPTLSFSANPTSIEEGATSTLTWDSTGADQCLASGAWSGAKSLDGQQIVAPATTSTYTLACGNENGTTTQNATVMVTPVGDDDDDAPGLALTAAPSTIGVGGTSTLTWDSTDADSCTATGGWSGSKALDGNEIVSPATTTTYALACVNDNGTTTASTTVTVTDQEEPAPTPTLTFSAVPSTIAQGGTSTLSWSTTNATACAASDGWTGTLATSGTEVVSPTTTTTYTLECSGPGGTTTAQSEIVTVTPAPTSSPARIVITEVLYDPRTSTSSDNQGTDSANEWVEIFNAGSSSQEMGGWRLVDGGTTSPQFDVLPAFTLDPGEYAVITNSTTTLVFWDIPAGTTVVALGSTINGGLLNTGDYLGLMDAASSTVDALSWGTNTQAFSPSVPDAPEGSSIFRPDPNTDTDTAADWDDDLTPTPGE